MKRTGYILTVAGLILLLVPSTSIEQVMLFLNYGVIKYWPISLVILGIYMQTRGKTKKRKTRS